MDARKLASFAVMAAFMAMNAATSKPKNDSTTSTSPTSTATSTSTSTSTTGQTGITPPDVDVASMKTTLGCNFKTTLAGCKLLADFDNADVWNDVPTSDTVFYGETNGISGLGEGRKEFFFLQVEAVPGVIQGQARTLIPETAKEKDDCKNLLAVTRAGGSLPTSPAVKFMRERPPGKRAVVRSSGKSQTLSGTNVFMRKKNDRILIVEYLNGLSLGHGGRENVQANGWVAELFVLR